MKAVRISPYEIVGDKWSEISDKYPKVVFDKIYIPLRDLFASGIDLALRRVIIK